MQEIFCSKCGTRNTGEGQFCQKCGAVLSPSATIQPASTTLQPAGATVQPVQASGPAYPAPPYAFAPSSPYGGFWIRLLAYIIDGIVLQVVATPFFFLLALPALSRIAREAEQNQDNPSPEFLLSMLGAISTFIILVFIGHWLYEALLTSSSWQGTVGKRILRLKVTDEAGNRIGFGRATGRFFGKILSHLILWIGFIMIAFTDRKRGLHDMMAGTLVMKY
jgi:uncharacterized RDD family membrane protein YckC